MSIQCRYCTKKFGSKDARDQHENSAAHPECHRCSLVFNSKEDLKSHRLLEHRARVEKPRQEIWRCNLCSITSHSQINYDQHIRGSKHELAVKKASASTSVPSAQQAQLPPGNTQCSACDTYVPTPLWQQHIAGSRHRNRTRVQNTMTAVEATEQLRHGININMDIIDFGVVDVARGPENPSIEFKVKNNGFPSVVLTQCKMTFRAKDNIFYVVSDANNRQITRTSSLRVKLELRASSDLRGLFQNRLELEFNADGSRFIITRPITAHISFSNELSAFPATDGDRHTGPRKKRAVQRFGNFHYGVRPQLLAEIKWARKLQFYPVPPDLAALIEQEDVNVREKIAIIQGDYMSGGFSSSTYNVHFQALIWIEELRAQEELSQFDLDEATLEPSGPFQVLNVPGLAEKRPSVLRGDAMLVRPSGSSEKPFEGYVHELRDTFASLHFNSKFKGAPGRKYEVHFQQNRLVFRRMHQALECTAFTERAAFPTANHTFRVLTSGEVRRIQPYNNDIAGNDHQRRAVASIVDMQPGSDPFIVYGPPGTGKTMTIVEAIRQVLKKNPNAKILACAPSNSAADIIVERLAELGRDKMIRLVAPSRSKNLVSRAALPFTRSNAHDVFVSPPLPELVKFNVAVTTCCSASVFYGIGAEPGHFSHIFVDESGQATEPEVMIPIRTMMGPETNVILSGDIKQLGPIVRSPIARELGLGKSYLERLMDFEAYNEDNGRDKTFVKLVKNYRSHPKILEFPNAKFYRGELVPCADREKTHRIVGRWDGLVNKDFPIVFHGICGRDEREKNSPSYFNKDEIIEVKEKIKSLLGTAALGLEPKDIGVITPYRGQVSRLRSHLGTFAKETRVGSVEEFQGQERPVIIMSTVRSSPDKINYDLRHTLGFVANPRRFNVAVTRAQALLIVVGDPFVLALDPLWREFINFVKSNGGYKGHPIDWDPNEPVDAEANFAEQRRQEGLSELDELVRRTSEMDLAADEEIEYGNEVVSGVFREAD